MQTTMRKTIRMASLVAVACLAGACATAGWDADAAQDCESIEMQVCGGGYPVEIEYHISPDEVPEAVRAAMSELYPGAPFTGAEHETHGGQLYWELTVTADGFDVEAMFLPDGTLHSQEIEVAEDTVPDAVKNGAWGAFEGGEVRAWEEIRNGERELTEYHVKIAAGGMNYKIAVSLDGDVTAMHREVQAEIEVPVSR